MGEMGAGELAGGVVGQCHAHNEARERIGVTWWGIVMILAWFLHRKCKIFM